MKSIAIKIKMYAKEEKVLLHEEDRVRAKKVMLLSLAILVLIYVFVIGSMIFNIVKRKNLEAEARALSNEVRELELNYLSLSDKIDLNFSRTLGFNEAQIQFATRKSLGSVKIAKNEL